MFPPIRLSNFGGAQRPAGRRETIVIWSIFRGKSRCLGPLQLVLGDEGRSDLAAILDELDFVKAQLARLPTRAYVSSFALLATGSVLWPQSQPSD